MQQKTLALFDFDGTLTKGDSLPRFLLFALPPLKLLSGIVVLKFKLIYLFLSGAWTNEKAKETLLSVFFKGDTYEALDQLGLDFFQKKMPRMLRDHVMAQLREYRDSGATIALVSASPDIWLRAFCAAENIHMICTELAYEQGRFTGKLAGPNCKGPEKARRIKATFELHTFEKIVAFGNSSGDYAMLALADEAWLVRGNRTHIYKGNAKPGGQK